VYLYQLINLIFHLFFRYRPDLIDFHTVDAKDSVENIQLAFEILESELGISPVIKPSGKKFF
jgi:hypothetical protein